MTVSPHFKEGENIVMTREEKNCNCRYGTQPGPICPVSPEELAALRKRTGALGPYKNGKTVHVFEERPDNLPEQAALFLNFHGGGF